MEFTGFACQYCSEHQEWDTRQAADSAAVWHLFDAHPLRWLALAGGGYPVGPAPSRLGPPVGRRLKPAAYPLHLTPEPVGSARKIRSYPFACNDVYSVDDTRSGQPWCG